jgi:hypothetical protein
LILAVITGGLAVIILASGCATLLVITYLLVAGALPSA